MPVGDIRPLKNELREQSKAFRREMSPELKRHHDEAIRRPGDGTVAVP